jgi:hypothetical protein
VNRIDQETEKEARAHKGCRAIQEEEEIQKIKTDANLAESSKENYDGKKAVFPKLMLIKLLNNNTLNSKHVYDTGHN